MKDLLAKQPAPIHNDEPSVWISVIADWIGIKYKSDRPISDTIVNQIIVDCHFRKENGEADYGTPLQINNGRDFLADAYQEALDLMVYLNGLIIELDDDPMANDAIAAYAMTMTLVSVLREMGNYD